MTICISAIATDSTGKEAIIFCTDHMISLPSLGQFEQNVEKYRLLDKNKVVMLAGNPFILNNIIEKIPDIEKLELKEIALKLQQSMEILRLELFARQVLSIYNLDFGRLKEYLERNEQLQNQTLNIILDSLTKFSLGTNLLLIGFNNKGKAEIYELHEKDVVEINNINFDAIGSGGFQAVNALSFQKPSKKDSIEKVLYMVYKAKKASEVAQGVGKETEVFVLYSDGLKKLSQAEIDILENISVEESKFGQNHKDLNKLKQILIVKNYEQI